MLNFFKSIDYKQINLTSYISYRDFKSKIKRFLKILKIAIREYTIN